MRHHHDRAEHGRVLDVTEETLGSTLVNDTAAGATSLIVDDAAAFEDDGSGGWLSINGQIIQYSDVDDDAGAITLLTPLTAAAEEGDTVASWNTLYQQPDTLKTVLVVVDGDDDNTDPVVATLADGVADLAEGLRGKAAETCTMRRTSADAWEITRIHGRPSSAQGVKFYDLDTFSAPADGAQAFTLTHTPIDGSVHMAWGGLEQPHTEYSRVDRAITVPDSSGLILAGDVFDFRYAYRDAPYNPAAPASLAAPLLLWNFNETGGTTAADSTVNNHSGTISGATLNQAAIFPARGSSFNLAAGSVNSGAYAPILNEWSLLVDINLASVAGFQAFGGNGCAFYVLDGKLELQKSLVGNLRGNTALVAGTNYRAAVVVSQGGNQVTFYLNGAADGGGTVGSGGSLVMRSEGSLTIGYDGGSSHLNGRANNVRYYGYPLTADQIATDWSAG